MPSVMPNIGRANTTRRATAGIASHGCLRTVRAQRPQPPSSTALSSSVAGWNRFGRLSLLTRQPSAASRAGSIVQAVNSVQSTTSTAPSAMPVNSGDLTMNSENSEIMTMLPENRIVRPLVRMAMPTAVTMGSGSPASRALTISSR